MNEPSGPALPEPFANYDPESCSWKTSLESSLWENLPVPSETWPRSGMTRRGRAYALPTSAPPTAETGASSPLPTPTARDWKGGAAPIGRSRAGRPRTLGDESLPDRITRLFPTPGASDGSGGRLAAPGHQVSLPGLVWELFGGHSSPPSDDGKPSPVDPRLSRRKSAAPDHDASTLF